VKDTIVAHVTLADQPRGAEFEFRMVAFNRSGSGAPSNTVVVVP
jgi:hypothetical protein